VDLGILDQSKACTKGDWGEPMVKTVHPIHVHPRLIDPNLNRPPATPQVHALTGEQAQAVWTALGNPDWRPAPTSAAGPCISTS